MRSGAVVYSACLCGLQTPLARMEMREPGPHRFHDLEGSCSITGFPDSVSTTVCPYASRDLPTSPTASRLSLLSGGGSPVDLFLRRQRPDDARRSVGQRYRDHLARLAFQHAGQPRILCPTAAHRPGDLRHGAADQEPSKIALDAPGPGTQDLERLGACPGAGLAAGRVLLRNQAEPSGEVAAAPEALNASEAQKPEAPSP